MKNIDQYKEISNTKYGQSGIVYESSLTTTNTIYLTQKESENMHVYVSGTLKNNSSSTQVVKMSLIGFDQGEVQISILSGEILELKKHQIKGIFPIVNRFRNRSPVDKIIFHKNGSCRKHYKEVK